MHSQARKVWMTLQSNLNHPPPSPPLHSRIQRAKRAEARAAAKAAGSKAAKDVAVQNDTTTKQL